MNGDIISALTGLTEATEHYEKCEKEVAEAGLALNNARANLNNMQHQFDSMAQYLRNSAPDNTHWNP